MVRKLIGAVLDDLLKDRDLEKAIAHVKAVISDLLMNRIDMSDLVVSKNLSQARSGSASPLFSMPHSFIVSWCQHRLPCPPCPLPCPLPCMPEATHNAAEACVA